MRLPTEAREGRIAQMSAATIDAFSCLAAGVTGLDASAPSRRSAMGLSEADVMGQRAVGVWSFNRSNGQAAFPFACEAGPGGVDLFIRAIDA